MPGQENRENFTDYLLPSNVQMESVNGGLRLRNLREVGDLNYEYDSLWQLVGTIHNVSTPYDETTSIGDDVILGT